jgi:hypothetical protein
MLAFAVLTGRCSSREAWASGAAIPHGRWAWPWAYRKSIACGQVVVDAGKRCLHVAHEQAATGLA